MHRELPHNYRDILSDEIRKYAARGLKIGCSWLWDGGGSVPNATSTIPGVILINAEWASTLVLRYNEEIVRDAFGMTMGHEITHQEGDYFYLEPFTKSSKFVNWVNEIHADFGGIKKVFDGDMDRGLRSLEFKMKCKGKRDRDRHSHPSWKHRMEFVSNGIFDDKTIKKIAIMTECKDEILVERVCDYYGDIFLRRLSARQDFVDFRMQAQDGLQNGR